MSKSSSRHNPVTGQTATDKRTGKPLPYWFRGPHVAVHGKGKKSRKRHRGGKKGSDGHGGIYY